MLYAMLLVALPLIAAGQPATPTAEKLGVVVASSLHAALDHEDAPYSDQVLKELATDTGLSEAQLCQRLNRLLDQVETSYDTEQWKTLVEGASNEVPAETVDRFLRQVVRQGRGLLTGEGRYPLDSRMRQAAKRSRLPAYQARDILLQVLESIWTRSMSPATGGDFGVLVAGKTNRYEKRREALFIFHGTEDEAFVMEQVREIHRFMIPALVRRLPLSAHVRWAVRQREYNPLIEPLYKMHISIDNLTFTGSNRDLRPCMEATVDLLAWPEETPVQTWKVRHCTDSHGSASTRELTPFYREVADEVRKLLNAYVAPR